MKQILFFILLLICALAFAQDPIDDTPYLRKVEEADKACADGKWDDAERALREAMELEPENPANVLLLSNLGMIQFNLGKDSIAIETLNEAHFIAPVSVTILSNRAKVLTALGEEDSALHDYARIIELDSTYIPARFHHGLLALKHRDFNTAKADFEFMERNFPKADETNIAMATFKSSIGEYADALPYYNKVLITIKEPEYYGARAYCNLMTGNLQEASDDIAAALELSPDDGELYLYRAALNKMRYRPADATADAKRAIELGVDPRRAQPLMGK
ncbi:MAG: tetratricopeptide repeat protein [Duncaniella sp.]|nr:tetratricopeptide repeat protein [Muribaculum sp.]MCM1255812.1 tetratricopeptide repeat protein [Duncaniella sp.]